MKRIIVMMLFIAIGCYLMGGEIINGKKVYSEQEIMESFNGGKAVWNKFRAENPEAEFGTLFENREFKKANMEGYNLIGISFKGANMSGAKLGGADMEGCNLEDVNFYNADLKGTNLRNANMIKANLNNTALYKANMENAKVYLKWKSTIEKKNVDRFKFIDWER